jgi:hypothetical protein
VACVGELDSARGAVEQRGAQLALEAAHGRRDRGLDHVQPVGGAREARLLGDGDEDIELAELHRYRLLIAHIDEC